MAHVPGWYADPVEPNRLAYWDGQRWTGEHRPRPTWTDKLPGAGSRRRPPIPGHDRRQWLLIGGALLIVIGLAYAALPRSPGDGPRVLTDTGFVTQANDKCAGTLNGLRPPLVGDSNNRPSNTQLADEVERAADGLAALADDLRRLTAVAADRPHIEGWLADWDRYAEVGHRTADSLRSDKPNDAAKVGLQGDEFQKRADRFARANGVRKCQFFIVPPSTGRDPFSGG